MRHTKVTAEQEAAINAEMDSILSRSDESGLQLEVIWAAFKYKEEVPTATLLECLQIGADEWDV